MQQLNKHLAEGRHRDAAEFFAVLLLPFFDLFFDKGARIAQAGFCRALTATHDRGDLRNLLLMIIIQHQRLALFVGQRFDDTAQPLGGIAPLRHRCGQRRLIDRLLRYLQFDIFIRDGDVLALAQEHQRLVVCDLHQPCGKAAVVF